jgi:HAE1 family hydrophobic/amphiphilic exporter-1
MTAATPAATAGATAAAPPAQPVTLGQIADVRVGPAPLTAVTRTDGKASIGISVSKSTSGNTVDIAAAVAKELPAITRDLNGQATITLVVDQSTYIKESITSLWREGLLGAVFAVFVIWVFLRSWRSTLIASLSIPLSVVGALIILYSRGQSLNMLTLGGLTIAIGRVIDDSIVVIENTYRHLQEGDDIRTAAFTGTREVAGAITASTLTTVAVFLPLGFVHGLASEFFRPFALTVSFALLCSLFVALMVVPVASTWVLSKRQVGHRDPDEVSRLQRSYLPALKLALGHKTVTLVIAVAIFAGTMFLAPMLKTNLFDNSAQNTMSITQQMPPGTGLDATMAAAAKVEAVLKTTAGIDIYQVTGGSTGSLFGAGGGTSASASQAAFTITTDPTLDKNTIVEAVRAKVAKLQNVGSVIVTGEDGSGSMGGMSNMEVRVSAAEPLVLQKANAIVLAKVETVDGLANVTSNLSEGRPSATVVIDQAKAAAAGISPATLSAYLSLVLSGYPLGVVPTPAGPLTAQLSVGQITLPPVPGAVTAALTRIPVPGSKGMVPLSQIATVAEVKAPVQVTHVDGQRTASITASVTNNNIGAASTGIETALKDVQLPAGATWELAGATQMTNDVFRTLGIAMLIAILLVYIIMVATFRSLLNPLILLVSIPFAAVGAVLALILTGTALGMPSLIGLLMLIGIVVTNAIVLLDLVEQFRRQGMDARSAVIEGGRRRLRPILMTAVATILALTPMALGMGKGGFLSTPLAVVVIGGLFTSTLLTLILVPVLYVAFDRLRPKSASVPDKVHAVPLEAETAPG